MLTDPEIRDLSDDEHTYRIDPDPKAAAPRARVRYVIKPSEPLWLELALADSVILQLPVSRVQGGTAHQVTAGQWVTHNYSATAEEEITPTRPSLRSYFGGRSLATAARTLFLEIPVARAIALTGICSARGSLRVSAQSSAESTPFRRLLG